MQLKSNFCSWYQTIGEKLREEDLTENNFTGLLLIHTPIAKTQHLLQRISHASVVQVESQTFTSNQFWNSFDEILYLLFLPYNLTLIPHRIYLSGQI